MPLYKIISIPDGQIAVWQITEQVSELAVHFSPEELASSDFQKYSFDKRKIEWMASRLLIKELLGSNYQLSYLNSGKPILDHTDFKHISITHSANFVAVFVHKDHETGIDIESTDRDFRKIEKRYLSEEELREVGTSNELHCLYWCAKEAVFKLVLDEGIEFRTQIRIEPIDYLTQNSFTAKYLSGEKETAYRLFFESFANQMLVWVASQD